MKRNISSYENDELIFLLNNKIDEELEKEDPNMSVIDGYMEQIRDLCGNTQKKSKAELEAELETIYKKANPRKSRPKIWSPRVQRAASILIAIICFFTFSFSICLAVSPIAEFISKITNRNKLSAELELKDTIVSNINRGFIELPSRVVYEQGGTTYYYRKGKGKAYVYCSDPFCKHNGGDCFATPWTSADMRGFQFEYTFFINNRFYGHTGNGKIISFSFDGTDMKIEYNTDYGSAKNPWGHCMAIGPYIYIDLCSYASKDGKAHTLRFNVETGEMEDLTEKTGNYIYPCFFYNGEIYGYDTGLGRLKADLDLNYCVKIEKIPYSNFSAGSCFFQTTYDDKYAIGIEIYDMKTGESVILSHETLGIEKTPRILCVDENYIYFYEYQKYYIGNILIGRGIYESVYKNNNGSIYRIRHDGTDLTCVYSEPDFTIDHPQTAIIVGDQLLVYGQNIRVRNNVKEVWDKGLLVGTIGANGKISELKPVEVVG